MRRAWSWTAPVTRRSSRASATLPTICTPPAIGLGLALAKPHSRVFVIDGDGSLLMNLGSLATIGLLQPANLVLVVMDNEEYATTGGQATARAMRIDATTVVDEEQLRRTLHGARLAQRPHVVVAKVTESTPAAWPP